MTLLFLFIIISALYSLLFYFLIDLSAYFLFLWIPLGILLSLLTLGIILYLYLLIIGQHTKNNRFLKHFLLMSASNLAIKFAHIKFIVEGKENIPEETFVVYANHKSDLDPLLVYYGVHKRPMAAVGKKSLFQNHFMQILRKTFTSISLDRDNDREGARVMIEAIKQVKSGINFIIFPEGGIKTRDTEEMVDLRPGAYKLAQKPGATILPIAIIGSSQISKVKLFKKKVIRLRILKPIRFEDYKELNTTEIGTLVESRINGEIKGATEAKI
ncbi:MAG: 1-acyl-sn-glycerol-3-phosphate acyltransferase [Acholeplasmatales bacterium]|nr:1-acyl-sn-glycerol-3-phosphate acyltransferase [Acholeplasmatales bacterium]